MSSGYGITNAIAALATSAFTWSSAYTTNRDRLNDGKQDALVAGSSSAQASGQYLTIDLGSSQALVAWALLNHNLASGSGVTVEVRCTNDVAWGSHTVAKAATTINTARTYDKDCVLQFPGVTARYWRLVFVHSGTHIVTLGELFAFTSLTTLSRQTIYGAGETKRYVQNRNVSDTGQARATLLSGPLRTKDLPFKDLRGVSERDELMAMFDATYGGVLNLLYLDLISSSASAGSAESQQCLWGKLEESFAWTEGDFLLFDVAGLKLSGLGRGVG